MVSSNDMSNIKPAVIALGELNDKIKDLTEAKKELEKQVREVLVDKGEVVFGDYSISVTTSPGRKTLDKSALEEAGVSLDQFYKTGAPFSTMKIKKISVV